MVRRVTPTKSPGVSLAAPSRQWASSPYSDLPLEGCPVAICRSSMRECRQGYATTLLSSVKRQVSAASRIILAYRHGGRGRARSVGPAPWLGTRSAAMTAKCCQVVTSAYVLDIFSASTRAPVTAGGDVFAQFL